MEHLALPAPRGHDLPVDEMEEAYVAAFRRPPSSRLDMDQAADLLECSRSYVLELLQRNDVPVERYGRTRTVD